MAYRPQLTQASRPATFPAVAIDETGSEIAVEIAGEHPLTLYVDKQEVATSPASSAIRSSVAETLVLGRFNGGGFQFNGDLDEVAIYGTALTNDQVHHHYNQAVFGSIFG